MTQAKLDQALLELGAWRRPQRRATLFDLLPGGLAVHFGVREHAMAAMCNGVALHGGRLTVANADGGGALVTVELPVKTQ